MLGGFDLLMLAIVLFQVWRGYQKGLVRALMGVVGWLAALYIGSHFAAVVAPAFAGVVASPALQTACAFVVLVIAVLMMMWGAGMLIRSVLHALALGPVERLAGAAFGAVKGVLVVLIVMSLLSPFAGSAQFWQRSQAVPVLLPFAPIALELSRQFAEQTWQGLQTRPDVLS
jgi:membrane protein required for colicin V production